MQVVFLELEGHPQLLEDEVVGYRQLDRLRWAAVILAAAVDHQAVEKVRHDPFRAPHEAFLVFLLQVGGQHQGMHVEAG
ncbi:hypothetical protein D3C77_708310 [compost metagenome]